MKRRLSAQPSINVSGDRVSSSVTINPQPQSQMIEESGKGQDLKRMLLRSATYVRDAEVEISSLRSDFLLKDKVIADANAQIQKLNTLVTSFQEKQTSLENELKVLKETKAASDLREETLNK
ncbi:hypothetical protein AHAS_Ahas17G0220200 [Arachis hypogaea]